MFGLESILVLYGQIRADMLLPIGIVVALAVTAHILLTKRDVGAAIGWIGLAWLTPIVGGILYFSFGINRVKRRGRKLRDNRPADGVGRAHGPLTRDDHLAPLEHAGRRITLRPALPGNAVCMFHNGDQAYPAMLEAIAGATRSIAMSSYIFRDDSVGRQFIAALAAARARGVEVRVIIDGVGGGYLTSHAYHLLRGAGVPVERFMHTVLPWRMSFLNLRTHKKILLLDGRMGFTGGMNISLQNMVATDPPAPVRDTHFLFEGPVVAQLMEAFVADWSFVADEDLEGELWFPPLEPRGPSIARVVSSGPDADEEHIETLLNEAIVCARRSILILTPYFLPDERVLMALALAALRGVQVDLVVPEHNDHIFMSYAMQAHVGPLLEAGCRIWRNAPPFDHSKVMVVDEHWCLIGSANWDVRSFRLNFELTVEMYDDTLARQLAALVQDRFGKPLTTALLATRPLPIRLRDAALRLALPYL